MTAARAKTEPVPPAESPPTASAPEAFDPRSLPIRTMSRGGAQYLDVKYRLVWLREEHPDASIETEEKGHDPGKWATFRATVSVPGGGSATGHGSETAGDFGDYYEKAETKALGRALAALGYGAQFLPDDGESLADAPMDGTANAPTPIDGRRQTRPPKDDHERRTRHFHAVGSSHGWSDHALHLLAVGSFPKHGPASTNSRSDLTEDELAQLTHLMEKTIGRMVNQGTGEIIPTPEVEYANAIAKATDAKTLDEIAKALKEGGISKNWLKAIWKRKQFELLAAVDAAVNATVAP